MIIVVGDNMFSLYGTGLYIGTGFEVNDKKPSQKTSELITGHIRHTDVSSVMMTGRL